jgi:hypothetical protein
MLNIIVQGFPLTQSVPHVKHLVSKCPQQTSASLARAGYKIRPPRRRRRRCQWREKNDKTVVLPGQPNPLLILTKPIQLNMVISPTKAQHEPCRKAVSLLRDLSPCSCH